MIVVAVRIAIAVAGALMFGLRLLLVVLIVQAVTVGVVLSVVWLRYSYRCDEITYLNYLCAVALIFAFTV